MLKRTTMKIKEIKFAISVSLGVLITVSSCTSICEVSKITHKVDGKEITFAESRMPCKKVDDFKLAVNLTIESVYSEKFETLLTNYIKDSLGTGEHTKAWEGVIAKDVVQKMRENINGTSADTYGGVKGLWLHLIYGNIAYDGTENGPILFNRVPLKNRNSPSISNTIAHEISHRIGLKHPHSDSNLKIAYREPPYVIGNIVEEIANEILIKNNQ